ncbi:MULTISPECIES: hypothetical protein [Aquimarina]|uniref:hypothetical protein n=1 Tax=Aquimarina TaxID=290174 RepID=UPI000D6872AA|nr:MULTISPECIES: hypothetical protein [Aquimarina]
MERLFFITFLFISPNVNCQNNELENFTNQVLEQVLPKGDSYYNILDKSFILTNNDYELQNHEKIELLRFDSEFPLNLMTNLPKNKEIINWTDFKISKAKYISKKECRSILRNEKPGNKVYYGISTPIFSNNKDYGAITISTHYLKKSEDVTYVLRFEQNRWKVKFHYIVGGAITSIYH